PFSFNHISTGELKTGTITDSRGEESSMLHPLNQGVIGQVAKGTKVRERLFLAQGNTLLPVVHRTWQIARCPQLGEVGVRLAGPLGKRGKEVVATGAPR